MHILALEPYYGGSHRAFLDGWIHHSRHRWTTLTLEPFKWKWRMRHSAVTFADIIASEHDRGARWDAVFCSDMVNLAELLGLTRAKLGKLPSVVYFHENQITYPVRHESERDYHFGFTNITTALAADAVWFNSDYHRRNMLAALPGFLSRMPDHRPDDALPRIEAKAQVQWPGIEPLTVDRAPSPAPLHILWAARWEHDKQPELLFDALRRLRAARVAFQLSLIGEQFREAPPIFAWAHDEFRDVIQRWGYQESRQAYADALADADVFVSTAAHEFFGISTAEAISAGLYPLLPRRLAYPELLAAVAGESAASFLYDGSASGLAEALADLANRSTAGELWRDRPELAGKAAALFGWTARARALDDQIERAAAMTTQSAPTTP